MTEKSAAQPGSPASPTPGLQIPTTPAPGLRGQGSRLGGMQPRQTFAPVNMTVPTAPEAGASAQKSMTPPSPRMQAPPAPAPMAPAPMIKMNSAKGNEVDMGTAMGTRPLRLQDMLKTAMAESAQKVSVSVEAARHVEVEKTASAGETTVDDDFALKLASAVEEVVEAIEKDAANLAGPYNLTEGKVEPGKGPGALTVLEATGSNRETDHQGHGHNTVPMRTGTEKVHKPEHGATANETNMSNPAGFHQTQTTAMSGGKGKTAGVKSAMEKCAKCGEMHEGPCKEEKKANASPASKIKSAFASLKKQASDAEKEETQGMAEAKKGLEKAEKAHESEPENKEAGLDPLTAYMLQKTKLAEDAINPAQISAGAAVPPETSEAGQSGGQPAGGAPQGPSGLVGSNESAQNYKKNQAYAPRKAELGQYFNEPALTMSTDKTLAEAFEHTSQAGTKFASAGAGSSTKVAAARAVIAKLAEEAEQNKSAKDPSGQNKGAAPSA